MHPIDVSRERAQVQLSRRRSRERLALVLAAALLLAPRAWATGHDELTIGISQFPTMLNPNIEAVAAKSYVLGFSLRPFTVFDADWKIVCLLCTELPSFANGRAVATQLPEGKKGIDLTYTIRADAKWADGVPVTTDDVKFTYDVGRHPQSAISNAELYRRITAIDVADERTFTMHFDKLAYDFEAARLERNGKFRRPGSMGPAARSLWFPRRPGRS